MVRRARNEMRLAELRYVKLASLQCPVSGGNRCLQDEEIAMGSSGFPSWGSSSICGSPRYSRLCNCDFFQLPLRRVARLKVPCCPHHRKIGAFCRGDGCLLLLSLVRGKSGDGA